MSMRPIQLNVIDLPKADYTGGPSSLCPGCGHDQIPNVIAQIWNERKDLLKTKKLGSTIVVLAVGMPFLMLFVLLDDYEE